MSDQINRTADWAPGTLDKTRKNIGEISEQEANVMAKKLGGKVMYERSEPFQNPSAANKAGRIIRNNDNNSGSSNSNSQNNSKSQTGFAPPKKHSKENLPVISKKVSNAIDKLMMSHEYKIKPNYGFFNFLRGFQKNGTEKILPEFLNYTCKQMIDHMENFITIVKTLIQIAPATYKSKIANGTEVKFKFLRMVASWSMQPIKIEYVNLQSISQPVLTADFIPFVRAIYHPLITIYYFGNNKIPKLIKEIYTDESNYPDAPKDQLSNYAKTAITQWLYIDTEIIKKLYPLLLRFCSDTFEPYPTFFNTRVGEILKFTGLHKFDLLLPEKTKEEEKPQPRKKPEPPQKGIKDSTVTTGIQLLNQIFPEAGFDKLDSHPDLYPYFQPLFKFNDGFNLLSPENPLQTIVVLHRIIEDCFQACRNIKFPQAENHNKDSESFISIMDEWAAYREESFELLYGEPLCDLVNTVYSQPDYDKSHIGKKIINSLLWQTTYHFLPNFKFEKLILEHPADESKYKPLFHRTDFARKYLTLVINECDQKAKTKAECKLIENPWEHYSFTIPNEVSKRIDVLLGAQNKTANTSATNANILKYTLCFISVLDWYLNNPDSPAYTSDPMHIWRISEEDGKPLFSVPVRNDQNKLFVEGIKANYKKSAK